MRNETKKLDILVGDDAFKEIFTNQIFETDYVPRIKEKLNGYVVNVETEIDSDEVIRRAPNYDVVVSDLDYAGGGRGKEGYDVVDAVTRLGPKPLLILCTSSDAYDEIKERTNGKIDYHAGTGLQHKFDHLVEILAMHYNERGRK